MGHLIDELFKSVERSCEDEWMKGRNLEYSLNFVNLELFMIEKFRLYICLNVGVLSKRILLIF